MRSDVVTKGMQSAPQRSLFNALGMTKEELERPLVGIVSSYNEIVPGHMNIDKIVDAYAKRVDVDKFAHVADMQEIEENGYNLNIPRYVDTFEEEEPVDLDAVKSKIQTLDSETKAAIDKAESFMRQLGL